MTFAQAYEPAWAFRRRRRGHRRRRCRARRGARRLPARPRRRASRRGDPLRRARGGKHLSSPGDRERLPRRPAPVAAGRSSWSAAARVAQRRLPLLLANGADVHVITRAATPAVEAHRAGITLELRDYRDGDLDGAWYAIAATDDPAVNAAVVAEAERSRIFCVRADVARDGTAVTPASFEYDGLVGRGAGRRRAPPLGGHPHRRSARRCRAASSATEVPDALRGAVALVGGGPGDPELITVRGRRLLAQRRRRGRRPARAARTAGRTRAPRRGDRRLEDPVRPGDGSGRDQRRADRPRQGGQVRRATQGR